jgi:hypothetical protein
MKNYCTKDSTCSATCLEETKTCAFYASFIRNSDVCIYCNRNGGCMSPEAHKDANQEDKR